MFSSDLPEFDQHGYLPDDVYTCDEEEFYDRFVKPFPHSQTRSVIYDGFMRLRLKAEDYGICATQWIDGSFVTDELDPNDVDVVTFIDYDEFNNFDLGSQQFVENFLDAQEGTVAEYGTHTIFVTSCLPRHPYFGVFDRAREYWRHWLANSASGTKAGLPSIHKGFIEMALGDPLMTPKIDHRRY